MRDQIIDLSIEELKKDGLRFSVDTIALKLHISKKTIYKYFNNKEELASAVYESYYDKANTNISLAIKANAKEEILLIYYDSFLMTRDSIFNKYAINSVKEMAINNHNLLWSSIEKTINKDAGIIKTIIDGSFNNSLTSNVLIDELIKYLVKLL